MVDDTLALFRDPYRFLSRRREQAGGDVFEARILLQKTACMVGRDAAELFYDPRRFRREGAAPARVLRSLFGSGGVQGLDGEAHRHRKAMFLSLMTPERLDGLCDLLTLHWHQALKRWSKSPRIVLFREVQEVLCRTVCGWSGVPLPEEDVRRRTREFDAMIDGAAGVGPRYWRARVARRSSERWIAGVIDDVRTGRLDAGTSSPVYRIATYKRVATDGRPGGLELDRRVAAVELINVLRPTVAVAHFVALLAHALHEHPSVRPEPGAEEEAEAFVHEVRRFYPFFPVVAARAREDFTWRGFRFRSGQRVLLDLHGTDHDPRIWDRPQEFRPSRFRGNAPDPYGFVPQGGGDHLAHHRCAGEWATIALLKTALALLTDGMHYDLPEQDLGIDLSRAPTLPRSGIVLENVRPRTS